MVSYANKPIDAVDGSIWRQPTRFDKIKTALFGWYLVRGGAYDPATGTHTADREYFQPAWLVWIKNKFAPIF